LDTLGGWRYTADATDEPTNEQTQTQNTDTNT